MTMQQEIAHCLSKCKSQILTYAEASLPASQFKAFRKLVLDEFGRNGLESDLEKILTDSKKQQER